MSKLADYFDKFQHIVINRQYDSLVVQFAVNSSDFQLG